MKHNNMLIRVTFAIAAILAMLVASPIAAASPCVLLCAGPLPSAMTQLGLIPGGDFSFSGSGGQDGMVVIFDPSGSGDPIGTASAHGGTAGTSMLTMVTGGQLIHFGSAFATAAVTIDPDFAAGAAAHTLFDFWLQLVPPSSALPPLIPVNITDLFNVAFPSGGGNAVGQVVITGGPDASQQPVLFSDEVFDPTGTGLSLSHTVMTVPAALFHITLETKANVYAVGGGVARASIDPTFQIDPSVPGADSFAFAVSPELVPASVPEPGTFLLLAVCLGIFSCIRRSPKIQ